MLIMTRMIRADRAARSGCLALAALVAASTAFAADSGRGQRLAQQHCSPCHVVAAPQRNEVAGAPPFDVIGRKYGFDVTKIGFAILGPHPRMNFSPRRADADDIAAYIGTLSR
jgi:mono/diheme cytochrome c family protein